MKFKAMLFFYVWRNSPCSYRDMEWEEANAITSLSGPFDRLTGNGVGNVEGQGVSHIFQ